MESASAWTAGRRRDNVFVERRWRMIKSEQVCIPAYGSMDGAKKHLKEFLESCYSIGPHQLFYSGTPGAVYFEVAGAEKHPA